MKITQKDKIQIIGLEQARVGTVFKVPNDPLIDPNYLFLWVRKPLTDKTSDNWWAVCLNTNCVYSPEKLLGKQWRYFEVIPVEVEIIAKD